MSSFLPSFVSSPLSTITSWLADDSMMLAAQSGVSIGPEVYSELDPRMTEAPKDVLVAYEQAIYFVALAARRAMREGTPTAGLLNGLNAIAAEADAEHTKITWFCTLTGFGCPSGGSVSVLNEALHLVEDSGLPQDDVIEITTVLKANRWHVQARQALPLLAVAVLSGLAAGAWWYHSRRTW